MVNKNNVIIKIIITMHRVLDNYKMDDITYYFLYFQ